jgi:hypothetical protein
MAELLYIWLKRWCRPDVRRSLLISRLSLGSVALLAVGIGIWCSFQTLMHALEPVYDVSPLLVAMVLLASVFGAAAATVLVSRGQAKVVFAVLLAELVVGFAFLVFPTLGLLLLVGLGTAIVIRTQSSSRWASYLPSAAGASVLALSLIGLMIAGNQRPIVECHEGGASMYGPSFPLGESSSIMGRSSTKVSGTTRGWVSFGQSTYHFECRGTRLVSFSKKRS